MIASEPNQELRPLTLVIGLGNPLLGDDGVGWRVAEACAARLSGMPQIQVDCHAGGGLSLMERMVGFDRAIVVDAINLGQGPTGTVSCFPLEELPKVGAGHLASAHETNLALALQTGKMMGAHLPNDVIIVAIESPHVYEFSESLTPPVADAVPLAVQRVLDTLSLNLD